MVDVQAIKTIKKTFFLSLISLCCFNATVVAGNISTPNDTILKLYPMTSGSFWNVLNGAKAEVLFKAKAKQNRYYGVTVGVSKVDQDASLESDDNTVQINHDESGKRSLVTLGGSVTDYIKPSGSIEIYTKKLLRFDYLDATVDASSKINPILESESTIDSTNKTKENSLTFQYNIGFEKSIWNQFGLGIEVNLVNVSYKHSTYKTTRVTDDLDSPDNFFQEASSKQIDASLFNKFEVYVRYKF